MLESRPMAKLTPMMAQYKAIKGDYEDCILMFRLGDFYEMFFEDAVKAAEILQITLTARGKGEGKKVPMCGVPFHALDQYLWKLTRAGKKVAICDQVTAPNGKGIVEREVKRVVTPGTTFDEKILESKANNFVSAVVREKQSFGFAWADVTTGDFKVSEFKSDKELLDEIGRVSPSEVVGSESDLQSVRKKMKDVCAFEFQSSAKAEENLTSHFGVKSLSVFGLEGRRGAMSAASVLLDYLKETQKTDLKHIQKVGFYEVSQFMPMDETVVRNLELFYTNRGKKEGSLVSVLDQTASAMGGRMLRSWLLNPLLDVAKIEERHGHVKNFVSNSGLLREVRDCLSGLYDIERVLSKMSVGSGNARDLLAIGASLALVPEVAKLVPAFKNELIAQEDLVALISRVIKDEVPHSVREGGMIADGYNEELDELRGLSKEGKKFLQELQERETARTGASSLKVKFNKVFGYYIEISKAALASIEVPMEYVRKQTLVNAERFITPELKEYEEKVLSAEDRIKELEYELFYEVMLKVLGKIVEIQGTARALAQIDVLSSFAWMAERNNYCQPIFGEEFKVSGGRHPVVEKLADDFVPNDCMMNESERFLLITGPNMGGKSTYLRQVALISLMAQVGSFVPASEAHLQIVDRIFTRVGASDNLASGDSTFMVEMQEASFILNTATKNSLVILDEIGRGTSTYDGVSIAWAMMEHLHNKVGARVLFATHYHELIDLADELECAKNLSVVVKENAESGVVFLYKVTEGGVDKSYGIEVAKLAGMPGEVVVRARGVLGQLEKMHSGGESNQMNIFETPPEIAEDRVAAGIVEDLKMVDINDVTPLQALAKLDELKKKL